MGSGGRDGVAVGGSGGDASATGGGGTNDGGEGDGTGSSFADADANGADGDALDGACVPHPLALLLMVDSTGSMATVDPGQTLSRWEIITNGLPAFASSPENAGLFVGLDFFPEVLTGMPAALQCDVTAYESPDVPIAALPGVNNEQVEALTAAIANRVVGGGTPTTPALQGAIASAGAWRTAHPEQDVFVVFLTDGIPNGCSSTVATAATAAAAGVSGDPSIKTYVVGVGPEVVANLDPIAAAGGGSPKATALTMGGPAALTDALNAIRASVSGCH